MSKTRLLFFTGAFFAGILIFNSCYYDNEEELYPGACDASITSYEAAVSPILESQCYGCHSVSAAQGDIVIEGYESLMPYVEDGSLFCTINWESGCSPMPKNQSQLSSCELTIINTWIENGGLNN